MLSICRMEKVIILVIAIIIIFSSELLAGPDMQGDIRYRQDRTDEDGRDSRYQQRIRGRIGAAGKARDGFKYGIHLATGSSSPTSANQTLGSGFSSKNIYLDRLFINYAPRTMPFSILAGKFEGQFYKTIKSELVWDSDLNTEGLEIDLIWKSLFIKAGYLWLEERSNESDSVLHAAQIGFKGELGPVKMTIGGGYYDYTDIKGNPALYDSTDGYGNTTYTFAGNKLYTNDYNLKEAFLEIQFGKFPLSFYGNYVQNGEVSKNKTAWLAGFRIKSDLKLQYNYRQVEKDSVVGLFTDSDFNGGGTDGKGHELGVSYPWNKYVTFAFTHFFSKTSVVDGKQYHRTFLDFVLKF
jgi:hypothetical protein